MFSYKLFFVILVFFCACNGFNNNADHSNFSKSAISGTGFPETPFFPTLPNSWYAPGDFVFLNGEAKSVLTIFSLKNDYEQFYQGSVLKSAISDLPAKMSRNLDKFFLKLKFGENNIASYSYQGNEYQFHLTGKIFVRKLEFSDLLQFFNEKLRGDHKNALNQLKNQKAKNKKTNILVLVEVLMVQELEYRVTQGGTKIKFDKPFLKQLLGIDISGEICRDKKSETYLSIRKNNPKVLAYKTIPIDFLEKAKGQVKGGKKFNAEWQICDDSTGWKFFDYQKKNKEN